MLLFNKIIKVKDMRFYDDEWYTLHEVAKKRFIPYFKSYYTLRNYVQKGWIKANVVGSGTSKRYYIKGENIRKFLEDWEGGRFEDANML